MATLATPLMDNVYLDTHFFSVPVRLVWDNFQKFMGEQENPGDSIDYLVPTVKFSKVNCQSLADYMGIPIGDFSNSQNGFIEVNCLPFRCFWLIWNEWFRDQNLQNSIDFQKGDNGGSSDTGFTLWKRGKRHDYFTSCSPLPQKGDAIEIPLTGDALIYQNYSLNASGEPVLKGMFSPIYDGDARCNFAGLVDLNGQKVTSVAHNVLDGLNVNSYAYADLSNVNAATINSLRLAFQLQRFLERSNRSGTRYTEILRGMFNVVSPDARLQRPEYLGGSSTRFMVNTVEQTSATGIGDTPQGNLSAFAVAGSKIHGFTKSFVEHCYIIGLVSVRADLNYQQGLNRLWSRSTRFDFYWPTLAHLGEQAVLNKEIYLQGNSQDDEVFGYQERWAEYRYMPNQITGKFRSSFAQSLDVWHLAQEFTNLPKLNSEFIQDNPPIDRVLAVQDEPQFLLDAYYKFYDVRPMPTYSVPGLIDHF